MSEASAAAAILFAAYCIRGITGFGSGLIAVPLLALMWPLTFVVPFVLLLDFAAALITGGVNWRQVQWGEVSWLTPMGLVGVALGTSLLVGLPERPLLVALACFIALFALHSLLSRPATSPVSRFWAAPAALAGGTIGALFGTGGPPYVIYLTRRIDGKVALVATLSAVFFFEGVIRIAAFAGAGLLGDAQLLWRVILAMPIMGMALYAGSRIQHRLSRPRMVQLIGVLLLLSSLSLLVKAFLT